MQVSKTTIILCLHNTVIVVGCIPAVWPLVSCTVLRVSDPTSVRDPTSIILRDICVSQCWHKNTCVCKCALLTVIFWQQPSVVCLVIFSNHLHFWYSSHKFYFPNLHRCIISHLHWHTSSPSPSLSDSCSYMGPADEDLYWSELKFGIAKV